MFLLVSSFFKEFYCTYLTIYSKEILPFLQLHRLFQSCVCASGIWTLYRYGDEDDRLDEMDLSGDVFSLGGFYHSTCDEALYADLDEGYPSPREPVLVLRYLALHHGRVMDPSVSLALWYCPRNRGDKERE